MTQLISGFSEASLAPRPIGATGDALHTLAMADDGGGFPAPLETATVLSMLNTSASGALKIVGAQQWALTAAAAGGAQASATRNIGANSLLVFQGVHAAMAGAGASFQDIEFRVRDALTAAVLFRSYLFKPPGAGVVSIAIGGLSVPLSDGADLIAEFSAAPGDPNVFQSFSVYGIAI